jgi:hypothetical protein
VDGALDRYGHGHGLAVDADRDLCSVRGDGHLSGCQDRRAGRVPAPEQAGCLPGAGHPDADDAQHPAVQLWPSAQPGQVPCSVPVVGHQQRLQRVDLDVVRPRLQVRATVALQQIREHVEGRRELVISIGGRVDDLGVGAEGGVVDEGPAADDSQVDVQLDAVGQRVETGSRVVAIEAEVRGKVIPGAGRDDHERDAVTRGDTCDEALCAVAAGDAEQVRAAGYCLVRDDGNVDRRGAIQQEHPRTECLGSGLQVEFRYLAATGHRIHDQKWPSRHRPVRVLWHPPVALTGGQRGPAGYRR